MVIRKNLIGLWNLIAVASGLELRTNPNYTI